MAAENPAIWGKPQEMQKLNKEKSLLEKLNETLKDCLRVLKETRDIQDTILVKGADLIEKLENKN